MTILKAASARGKIEVDFENGRVIRCFHILPGHAVRECNYNYSERFVRDFYDKHGEDSLIEDIERNSFVYFRTNYMIERFIKSTCHEPMSILDYGCGSGISTRAIRHFFPNSQIDAADIFEPHLKTLENRFRDECSENVKIIDLNKEKPAGKYDIINLNAVFEHLTAHERKVTMEELWNCLKEGGFLVITETPWRWFPIETHTTSLPLLNFMPDALALFAYRFKKRKIFRNSRDLTWLQAQRSGIRGATLREIVQCTGAKAGAVNIVQSPYKDATDLLDTWWSGEYRPSRIKRTTYNILCAIRSITGFVIPPWINVVYRKARAF